MRELLHEHEVTRAAQDILKLGEVSLKFARVERAPRMPDGRRETDVEHSFHLAITAPELAARFYPDLDTGLVALFASVHDLVEVITGDVRTFNITDEDRAKKEAAEHDAAEYLFVTLPPFTADILKRYEAQTEPEARFVRLVDKMLPAVLNYVAAEAATFLDDYEVSTKRELVEHSERQEGRLRRLYPEFSEIIQIRQHLSKLVADHFFPETIKI
jgi:5'-deoxynucleotidase YfbR-like HD superfamily hydrolase